MDYDTLSTERDSYLVELSGKSEASSKNSAKTWSQEYAARKICCGKGNFPEQDEALPTPLLFEEFSNISEIFENESLQPTVEAGICATKVVTAMRQNFPSEDDRVNAFFTATSEFLGWIKSEKNATGSYGIRKNFGPDGFVEVAVPLLDGKKAMILLMEVKHEIGISDDPIVQVNLDYSKLAGQMHLQEIPGHFPCLLLTLSGTLLTVQFGIVGQYVKICSLCDGFQFQDRNCIEGAAKLLQKLKAAKESLEKYYRELRHDSHPNALPYLHSLKIHGRDVPFKYVRRIKQSSSSVVFEVKIDDPDHILANSSYILKFCKRYGLSAHQLLAGNNRLTNFSPLLYSTEYVHNRRWTVLLMEKIEGVLPLCKIRNELTLQDRSVIAQDLANAVNTLHQNGFAHGDLRSPNILVTKTGSQLRTYLIDFDFSGCEDTATYPLDLDLGNFPWIQFEDFPRVLKEHDWQALQDYCRIIRAPQPTEEN